MRRDFEHDRTQVIKNKKQVREHALKAIGIILKHVSSGIASRIRSLILPANNPPGTREIDHFRNVISFLRNQFGPTTLNDVQTIKQQLNDLTDSKGYRVLLDKIYEYRSILESIPQRDAANNIIQLNGVNQTYNISDAEMRSILLLKLGKNGNNIFQQLLYKAQRNPTYTYAEIVRDMENLLRDPKNDIIKTKAMASTSSSNIDSELEQDIYINTATQGIQVKCLNCKRFGHYVDQ
jgi:hypothetical protein